MSRGHYTGGPSSGMAEKGELGCAAVLVLISPPTQTSPLPSQVVLPPDPREE